LRICEPEGYSSAEIARQGAQMPASPDQQILLTDSDSRPMATSGRGSGV